MRSDVILRVATLSDIPILVQFGELFMAESPNYQGRQYDPEKAEKHYKSLLKMVFCLLWKKSKRFVVALRVASERIGLMIKNSF